MHCARIGESSKYRRSQATRSVSIERMLSHHRQQAVLGEWFGEVLDRAHHAAAGAIEQAILGREHDDGRLVKAWTALDQRAGLVAIEPGHQDVAENDAG